jgi:hypothetical protein
MQEEGQLALQRDVALVDLVDRLVEVGVVLSGDIALSLADVDLLSIQLQLLITPAEEIDRPPAHRGGGRMSAAPADRPRPPAPDPERRAGDVGRSDETPPRRLEADPHNVERGLAQLVLTIVELLRQLMERQVLRRVDAGDLDDETVERLGSTLMALADRMEQLKQTFGLGDEDLNLNLGPLGRLVEPPP